MTTSEERQLGRAKNAVLSFLESRLIVPKIYLDADWGGHHVDVLAIERDGVGDVHAVLICLTQLVEDGTLDKIHYVEQLKKIIDAFMAIPAQYKYIAVPSAFLVTDRGGMVIPESMRLRSLRDARFLGGLEDNLYAPDGIGRTGLVTIEIDDHNNPHVELQIKPERFRAKIAKLADDYVQQHEADWEIRA